MQIMLAGNISQLLSCADSRLIQKPGYKESIEEEESVVIVTKLSGKKVQIEK